MKGEEAVNRVKCGRADRSDLDLDMQMGSVKCGEGVTGNQQETSFRALRRWWKGRQHMSLVWGGERPVMSG